MTGILLIRRIFAVLVDLLLTCGICAQSDRVFYSFNASNGLADNSAQVIKCTKTGRMVISTIGHINFYDGAYFTHIDPTDENIFPLPKYTGHYRLYFDKFHHIWLKDKSTVTCVDLLAERFIKDVGGVIRSLGMTKPVDDLFADINCNLWFLSGDMLYCRELGKEMPVSLSSELQDVDVFDNKIHLQFYANAMVSAYDMATGQHLFEAKAFEDDTYGKYASSSVVYPYEDRFYQIRNGNKESVLLCLDMKTRQWTQLLEVPYHLNNMAVYNNHLYIASEYGYWIHDIATGEFVHHKELSLTQGRKLETDVNTISFDRQGGMWVGTERRGLLYAKPFSTPFRSYTWDQPEATCLEKLINKLQPEREVLPRHVNCRFTDSRGWIWTGTYTGLQVSKDGGRTVRTYMRKDGLLNEMIHSVIEDDSHNIWVGTSFGISLLNVRGDSVSQIESYFEFDNVPRESFVNGRVAKLDDGTIVMQSLDHIVTFNPSMFRLLGINNMRLYPKLVRLMVDGRVIEAGDTVDGRVILDRAVTRVREVAVNYDQNSLLLTFSGLNYLRPIQTYYRYRIVGLQNEWKVVSHSNSNGQVDRQGILHLLLSGLRPGKYVIEMQVSLSSDDWQVEPLSWTIYVQEPWWRTTGVYMLLALVLLLVLLANIKFYNRNTRLQAYCNNEEEQILRKLRSFINRSQGFSSEVLTPSNTGNGDEQQEGNAGMSQEFQDFIMLILPLFDNDESANTVTMSRLADIMHMSVTELSELISDNVYKSPRHMSLRIRLHRGAQLLLTTEMAVEDIANECGFSSPNYFIASFYHQYRQTPADYRSSIAR
jgi:AraC-like DNA-binding protein